MYIYVVNKYYIAMQNSPLIAVTMHNGVHSPIEQSVLGIETRNPEGTSRIVSSTAFVRGAEQADVRVFVGTSTLAAPFCAGHPEVVTQISSSSGCWVIFCRRWHYSRRVHSSAWTTAQ